MKDTQPRSPDGLGERLRERAKHVDVLVSPAASQMLGYPPSKVGWYMDLAAELREAATRIDTLTEQVAPTKPCDLFDNGGDGECSGPQFNDPQGEGVDLRVCAKHLIANRDSWMRNARQYLASFGALRSENASLTEQVRGAEGVANALAGLQGGTAHPDDPMLKGDVPCWCEPRGPFAQGPHDNACLAARAALSIYDEGAAKKP